MAEQVSAQERLDKIVVLIAANMVAEVCSCYVLRVDNTLELYATEGLNRDAVHRTVLSAHEGLVGLVASEATPVVIETRPEPEPVAEVAAEPAALAEQPVAEVPASEAAPAVEAAAEAPSGATAEAPAQTAGTEAATAEAAPAPAETPAEPQLVEVWRPGGRSDERRPHHRGGHDRNRGRHQGKPAEGAQAAEGGGEGEKREHHRRPRRHQDFRTPRPGAPADATAAAAAPADGAPARDNRQDNRDDRGQRRERFEGKGFEGKGRDRDNNERRRDNKFGGGDRKGERG
ncbi:hypothetical protein ACJH6J_30550, partial [Mycobacterium sp. SMC-18]